METLLREIHLLDLSDALIKCLLSSTMVYKFWNVEPKPRVI